MRQRAYLSVGFLVVLVMLFAVPVVDQFLFRYSWATQTLAEIESRHARLLGLRDAAPRIKAALAESLTVLERHAYPAEIGSGRVGADLQQRVRRIAEAAGVTVVGSQILPPRETAGVELVPLSATLDADTNGLADFLLALPVERPSIQVDNIEVTSSRQRTSAAEGRIRIQINVSSIRLLP
ncbi:type II secretion system protein GspM [Aromatoleum buckelii]|uniref:General secretion pathway protein M n=1 Tax=Aromatoleum buckelii TaxID=200254 RepID=A0ABX1N473_9RHOO|nr:type II secretion system protein GspM [Aromatoleum buckelii]MCK0511884.1 type II secretion system protein GspM [Aromatoleum buckelii]